MAPQNSTLLHEYFETTSELSRFSPILRLNEKKRNDEVLRQRKSISCKAVDLEQEDNEIPIWICGEPRFISGIISSTTCYELIQALIDDELHDKMNEGSVDVQMSRDLNDYVITERWRDVEQALPGETYILPLWQAWGTARNEIKFKLKINKNKVGPDNGYKNPTAKPKKTKFSTVRKLIRRLIHQSETIQDHLSVLSDNNREKAMNVKSPSELYDQRVMDNFLKDSHSSSNRLANIYVNLCTRESSPINIADSDELFLLIENSDDDRDSGVHVEYGQYILNQKCKASMQAKLSKHDIKYKMSTYKEIPKRRLDFGKRMEKLHERNLNGKLLKTDLSPLTKPSKVHKSTGRYDIIRLEILSRMSEVSSLLRKEDDLLETLSKLCTQYRSQNEIYTSKIGLEMEIEQVQKNLSLFAKEIMENELQLFETKMQVEQKLGIMRNLYRMLKEEEAICVDKEYLLYDDVISWNKKRKGVVKRRLSEENELCFVDNIYEFCDNNGSMIV